MLGVRMNKSIIIILIWLVAKGQVRSEEAKFTFRCKNGIFMKDSAFCGGYDGESCKDRTDEDSSRGCNMNACGIGPHYWCDNTCHEGLSIRCNTIADCADESDEYDCGDEINTHNCSFQVGKYLCDDNLRCLDVKYMCNGFCQCFDCSDEKYGCPSDDEMKEFEGKDDDQACFKTPNGPHCCTVFDYDDIFQRCTVSQQKQCEQKCVRLGEYSKCLCDENYIGVPGTKNQKCISNEETNNTLIIAIKNSIAILDLAAKEVRFVKNDTATTALTSAHDYIYYATYDKINATGYIFKTSTVSDDETYRILCSDSKITSLAIDWITNKTYYSTNSTIFACAEDNNGFLEDDFSVEMEEERTMCQPIKSCNTSSIGLAPRFGLIFWVEIKENDLSKQYIMRSAMDGSNEMLLNVRERVPWEVKISIDELTERVYFYSGRVEVTFVSFDGLHQSAFQPKTYQAILSAIFTTFEKKIFFSSLKSKYISVGSTSSRLMHASSLVDNMPSAIQHLYAFNPLLQRTKVTNKCAGSCPRGLCLLRPSSKRSQLDHTCFYNATNMRHLQKPKISTTPPSSTTSDDYSQTSPFSPTSLSPDTDSTSSSDDSQTNFWSANSSDYDSSTRSSYPINPSSSSDDSESNFTPENTSTDTFDNNSSTSSLPSISPSLNNDSPSSSDDSRSNFTPENTSSDAPDYNSSTSGLNYDSPSSDLDDSQSNFISTDPSFDTSEDYPNTNTLPSINLDPNHDSNSRSNESQPNSNLNLTPVTESTSASNFVSKSEFVSHSDPDCDSKNLVLIVIFNGIFTVCITIVIIILLIRNVPTLFKNIRPKQMNLPLQSMREKIDINELPK